MKESFRPKQKEKSFVEKLAQAAVVYGALAGGGAVIKKSVDRMTSEQSMQDGTIQKNENELSQMIRDVHNAPVQGFDSRFFTKEQLKCLTDNVYHEARGEPIGGRYAVVFATLERMLNKKSNEFPKSICGVVHQPWQFSWTKDEKILAAPINPREYLKIAAEVYGLVKNRTLEEASVEAGLLAGLPRGSIYYKDARFTGSERVQKFFATLHRVGRIGTHEFFIVPEHPRVAKQEKHEEKVPLPRPRPNIG